MRQSSLVVDAMPDAIIGFPRDREVILWNAGAERMYSILEREALGRKLDDLITTGTGPASQGNGGPAISLINKGSWTGQVRQRTLHRRVLHADVSIASIVEEGRLRGAVSINRDVSSLIEAEAAKAENERRMQALLDASRAMTAVFDREGTIIAVNAAWTAEVRLGGVGPEEVGVGADRLVVMRRAAGVSDDAAAVVAGVEAVLGGRATAFEWDYDVTEPDGSLRAFMGYRPHARGAGRGLRHAHRHHDPQGGRRANWPIRPATTRSPACARAVASSRSWNPPWLGRSPRGAPSAR